MADLVNFGATNLAVEFILEIDETDIALWRDLLWSIPKKLLRFQNVSGLEKDEAETQTDTQTEAGGQNDDESDNCSDWTDTHEFSNEAEKFMFYMRNGSYRSKKQKPDEKKLNRHVQESLGILSEMERRGVEIDGSCLAACMLTMRKTGEFSSAADLANNFISN